MPPEHEIVFVLIVTVAAYVQAVAGFALGLIVMGAATLFGLAPVAFTAVVVSLIALLNISVALHGHYHEVQVRRLPATCLGFLLCIPIGIEVLEWLGESTAHGLRQSLGLFLLLAGAVLVMKPDPRKRSAGAAKDFAAGALGGFFGGLFSTSGPPVVYHLYREPLRIAEIRATLLAIFGVSVIVRTATVLLRAELTLPMLWTSALCVPGVVLGSWLARRLPPPLSEPRMRRAAFLLLGCLGVPLLF